MKSKRKVMLAGLTLGLCLLLPMFTAEARGEVALASWMIGDDEAREQERALYEEGTEALDERRWDRAIVKFERVAEMGGAKADGALYWKAWAESRSGRRKNALETLVTFKAKHPNSRWLGDAKALEIELQKSAGSTTSPDAYEDEELKLIALYGIMENDPARGVAAVERILKGTSSLRMKERALYLLADSGSSEAVKLLRSAAKGGNPDLQLQAIRFIGVTEDAGSLSFLDEIYTSSNDPEVRYAVIEAWMEAEAITPLLRVAQTDPDPRLRMAAIHVLGSEERTSSLMKLYETEKSRDVRYAILEAFEMAEDVKALEQIMKTEKDLRLRVEAIHYYGHAAEGAASPTLVALFKQELEQPEVRMAALDALNDIEDADALINLAKSTKDPHWKREIVSRLANMDSRKAQEFLESLLN